MLTSLKVEYLHKLFEILLLGRFISSDSFINVVNHLFTYISMDHRCLFCTSGYDLVILYLVPQIVPALVIGTLSTMQFLYSLSLFSSSLPHSLPPFLSSSLSPFLPSLVFFIALWHQKKLQAHLLHNLPQYVNQPFFLRALVPLIGERHQNPRFWSQMCLLLLMYHFFQVLLVDSKCMCVF